MSQGNQKNLVQFCLELGSVVNEILDGSDELLSALEELFDLYQPRSREEAKDFYDIRFKLPDSVGLLCGIQQIIIPDDDEFYDSVAPLSDTALDVAQRMVSASVIINDIITMYFEPHEYDMYIHLYLAMLEPISNNISYMRSKLEELYKETSKKWPDLIVSDYDTDQEEDLVLPGDVESFQIMRDILVKTSMEYTKEHESERISEFFMAIQDYLEAFANGVEPEQEFDFGFVYKTRDYPHEVRYVDFHFELGVLQVSSGGTVFTEYIGSDSYTDWIYSIGLNGRDEGNYDYQFMTVLELVRSGAKLTIAEPDEYF